MDSSREKLAQDVKTLLADVEILFRDAATASGSEAQELRARAEAALQQVRDRFESVEKDLARRGREAAHATDEWVRHNPWTSIGIGAGVGVLVGMLIARR
jgi:ElaB/YqjD/DUF883 family membrane-anchored ribosome-binding protein